MNYRKIYDSLIERAKNRIPEGYVEKHHIIPKCIGGLDEADNLVSLYPEEHFLCHVLLVKIYPDNKNLILAVGNMCRPIAGRKKRKLYGWLRRKFSEEQSVRQSGEGNSQHKTRWITNGKEEKKVSSNYFMPVGWSFGRMPIPRKFTEKSKSNMSWLGRKHSPETKFKIRQTRLGKRHSENSKIKMRLLPRIGKKHSEQTKNKMSITRLGVCNSQYGTIWICNDSTKQTKKISKSEAIPLGWRRGRIKV